MARSGRRRARWRRLAGEELGDGTALGGAAAVAIVTIPPVSIAEHAVERHGAELLAGGARPTPASWHCAHALVEVGPSDCRGQRRAWAAAVPAAVSAEQAGRSSVQTAAAWSLACLCSWKVAIIPRF
jgi:hypothetical protein